MRLRFFYNLLVGFLLLTIESADKLKMSLLNR